MFTGSKFIHVLFLFETVCELSLLLKEPPSTCYTAPVQKNKHKRRLNISSQWNRQSLLSNQMVIKPKVSAKANQINVLFALTLPYKNEKDQLVGHILSNNHFVHVSPKRILDNLENPQKKFHAWKNHGI